MLFIIILTLSLEVIAVVSINLRVYVFLYTQFTARRRGHEQNISLTASCCCNEVKHVYKISINCDQISRHGNKDVKENSRSPWNIYGFVLITNFFVKSFLRGFLRGGILNVVDRRKSGSWPGSMGTTILLHPVLSAHARVTASASGEQWLTSVDTVDEIFQDGGRRFGTIFAKFYENVHLWDSLRADNKCWIFNWLFFLLQTEFEEELASADAAKCGESMESRAKSRGRVEENRTATKRVGGRESSGRDAETCCAARNSQVSEERKELLWIWRQLLKLDSLS